MAKGNKIHSSDRQLIEVQDRRNITFTMVDDDMIEDTRLDVYEKMTYICLCKFANKEMQCYPSLNTLKTLVGCSRRKLIQSLDRLIELGYIGKERRMKDDKEYASNLYTLYGKPPEAKITSIGSASHALGGSAPHAPGVVHQSNHPSAPDAPELYSLNYNQNELDLSTNSKMEEAATLNTKEGSKPDIANSNELDERGLTVDFLISFWNEQDITVHSRLGSKTRQRIQEALDEALQDYTVDEFLSTITNYADLYKCHKARHKYRLVEFMERRGYEVFSAKENWTGRTERNHKVIRADFTYRDPIAPQVLKSIVKQKPFEDKEAEFAKRMAKIESNIRGYVIYSEKQKADMIAEQAIFVRRAIEEEWAKWESLNDEIVAIHEQT